MTGSNTQAMIIDVAYAADNALYGAVSCAQCGNWFRFGDPLRDATEFQLRKVLRDHGWRRKNRRWICDECAGTRVAAGVDHGR